VQIPAPLGETKLPLNSPKGGERKWSGLWPLGVSNGQEHPSPSFIYTTVIEIRCKEKDGKEPDFYTKVQAWFLRIFEKMASCHKTSRS